MVTPFQLSLVGDHVLWSHHVPLRIVQFRIAQFHIAQSRIPSANISQSHGAEGESYASRDIPVPFENADAAKPKSKNEDGKYYNIADPRGIASSLVTTTVNRLALIHATGVFRVCILVHGRAAVVFWQELLDFPVPLLCADTEFKILLGDGIPVLFETKISKSVNGADTKGFEIVAKIGERHIEAGRMVGMYLVYHHHRQKIADGCNEQTVQVVVDTRANRVAKDIEYHLPHNKEEDTKSNISKRPSILQRIDHQDDLHDCID